MLPLPEWARLALAAFACFRLAQLLAHDEGPDGVFLKLRTRMGCYDYGANGQPKRAVGRFLKCPYCLGVWFAVPCAAGVLWPTIMGDAALAWLGIAGAQAWLEGRNDVEG